MRQILGPYLENILRSRRLFTWFYSDRKRGNGFKLMEGKFRLDVRGKLLTEGVVRCRNRLTRETVDTPSIDGV